MSGPMFAPEDEFLALIHSARVSSQTRHALLARGAPDDPAYSPVWLSPAQLDTLRAVVARVLPQPPPAIDIAARIDAGLGRGDGWRFAALPVDADAYRAGLNTIEAVSTERHASGFGALSAPQQDAILRDAADAGLAGDLDPAQTRLWFEDVRGDATRIYVAHPRTMSRIGYGGFAYGGDGPDKTGFVRIAAGERDDWEPMRAGPRAAS